MALRKVKIFQFSDLHRRLGAFPDGSGGAAQLTTLLRNKKAENPDSLTVNVGDIAGDNTEPGPDAFEPMAPLFNRMQVDLLALGNHEFEDPTENYGSLRHGFIEKFEGEVLCANVTTSDDNQPLEGTRPYTIRQLAGINVAFIGAVTRDLGSAFFPTAGAGLATAPIEQTLLEQIPRARAEGAEAFILMAHETRKDVKEIAARVGDLDFVMTGHGHHSTQGAELVERADGSQVLVSETQAYGKEVNEITLTIDTESRRIVGVEVEPLKVGADLDEDPVAEQLVEEHEPLQKRRRTVSRKAVEVESFAALKDMLFPDENGA